MAVPATPHIRLAGIARVFDGDTAPTLALREVSLAIDAGEFVCITGASGAGKTTLLHILGCLESPTEGSYQLDDVEVGKLDACRRARLRRHTFGFVSQAANLIETLSVLENVELPGRYAGLTRRCRRDRARRLLHSVGLAERTDHLPSELSGGERQRVMIARALNNHAPVILADEPAGSLDAESRGQVLDAFDQLSCEGHTVVAVSHDMAVAERASRRIEMGDGRVLNDTGGPRPSAGRAGPACDTATSLPLEGVFSSRRRWPTLLAAMLLDGYSVVARRLPPVGRTGVAVAMLSVAIGVGSAVALLGAARGALDAGMAAITHFGSDRITVWGANAPAGVAPVWLSLDDARAVSEAVPNLRQVVPVLRGKATARRGERVIETTVRSAHGGREWMRDRSLERGSPLTGSNAGDPAAILGSEARAALFGSEDPVGERILLGEHIYTVKGTLEPGGDDRSTEVQAWLASEADREIYVPVEDALTLLGAKGIDIEAYVARPEAIERAAQEVRDVLMRRHGREGFLIRTDGGPMDTWKSQRTMFHGLLAGVAVIMSLAGGSAIAATMLVSVWRRRREIGIRLLVGAEPSDIVRQFLAESVAVAVVACLFGLCLGVVACWGLAQSAVPISVSWIDPPAVVSAAVAIGLISGVWPASRASRLDPATAVGVE